MNRELGWRRLNVLVMRAKLSTRLFTSLRPDDIKVTPTSSRGVQAFKAYLTYAHQGATYDDSSGGEPDSDFEVFVADALRNEGYEIVHQVGVEGFRIDLGVKHADYPLGFIAGIECDGASFHSGLTVRDRDRIRQSVLERMGWRIYRIWSTDWFADPERETRKLLTWLEGQRSAFALEYASRPAPSPEASSVEEPAVSPSPTDPASSASAASETSESLPVPTPDRERPDDDELRSLDDFHWSRDSHGDRYMIWFPEGFAGEVEVLRRATGAARLYGGQAVVPRSEYEGWVEATGARFKTDDMYAAMREVARRARAAAQLCSKV
jgi:very-short-patch-repair endonuclease